MSLHFRICDNILGATLELRYRSIICTFSTGRFISGFVKSSQLIHGGNTDKIKRALIINAAESGSLNLRYIPAFKTVLSLCGLNVIAVLSKVWVNNFLSNL